MERVDDTRREKLVRTHNCGQLRMKNVGEIVTLAGWVHKVRDKNHFCFVDLRDRYGITQIVVKSENEAYGTATQLGREWVIRVKGKVIERSAKNPQRETGDIEIEPTFLEVLNASKTPPFIIEDETDGGEEIRMKFRYLDIRRNIVRNNLILRHRVGMVVRNYLTSLGFLEVETPVLIKSTPEGARDFVVPSRMNPGTFYALPQSPQIFKQLLMVGGVDKYFQIVKCFRDEELRADRQPEFTQIDCEMSFVTQEDIINTFEGMIKHVFREVIGVDLGEVPRMTWDNAIKYYGIDKPDLRFDMRFVEITDLVKGKGFDVFDKTELVVGVLVKGVLHTQTNNRMDRCSEE
jgi:aspartyl-tRNA synthetase